MNLMGSIVLWFCGSESGSVPVRSYPSGEPLIEWKSLPKDGSIEKVMLRPKTMLDLMAGLFLVDALMERGSKPPDLILPFVPGARQDRLNDSGDYLFTARSIAKEINARGFRSTLVLDPHSEVTPALIDRCRVVHAHDCLSLPLDPVRTYSAVISPDAGAEKRAGAVAKKFGIPMLHGWKTRDVSTGAITGFGLEPSLITGRVLIVDDICDGGGTFIGLASVLRERGLRSDLFVSHGIFSQGVERLREHYDTVFCTDSIDGPREGVTVIPMCKRLLNGDVGK